MILIYGEASNRFRECLQYFMYFRKATFTLQRTIAPGIKSHIQISFNLFLLTTLTIRYRRTYGPTYLIYRTAFTNCNVMGLLLSICVDESEHLWQILNIISSDAPLLTITGYVLMLCALVLLALQFEPH